MATRGGGYGEDSGSSGFGGRYRMGNNYGSSYGQSRCAGCYGSMGNIWHPHCHALCCCGDQVMAGDVTARVVAAEEATAAKMLVSAAKVVVTSAR